MKFLIQDYSTFFHTESKYFNHILNNIDGCSSVLWGSDNKTSVYDMMDMTKPDVVITHASIIHKDLVLYLSENKNIDLVLNISGISKEDLQNLENIFTKYDTNCSLCFVNYGEHYFVTKKFNIVSIYHGVDLFLPQNAINYLVDKMYLVYNECNVNDNCSYHIFSHNVNIENQVDAIVPAYDVGALYKNYNNVVIERFPHNHIVPQSFFDAVYYSKNVTYNMPQEQMSEIYRILKVDSLKDLSKTKQILKEKHTCLNRTKSLLSQLKCSDLVTNLSQIMKEGI
jgi:hypothetical protein